MIQKQFPPTSSANIQHFPTVIWKGKSELSNKHLKDVTTQQNAFTKRTQYKITHWHWEWCFPQSWEILIYRTFKKKIFICRVNESVHLLWRKTKCACGEVKGLSALQCLCPIQLYFLNTNKSLSGIFIVVCVGAGEVLSAEAFPRFTEPNTDTKMDCGGMQTWLHYSIDDTGHYVCI